MRDILLCYLLPVGNKFNLEAFKNLEYGNHLSVFLLKKINFPLTVNYSWLHSTWWFQGFRAYQSFNTLPDDKILDWSKLKQIADNI